MGGKLSIQSIDHPQQLGLPKHGHEAIKLGMLFECSIVTLFSELIAGPLACHLPHLGSENLAGVGGVVAVPPKIDGGVVVVPPPNGGRGGVIVAVAETVAEEPAAGESAAGGAPLSEFGFSFSSFVNTPASAAVAQVAAPSGSWAFSDCSGTDFSTSLLPTFHLALMWAVACLALSLLWLIASNTAPGSHVLPIPDPQILLALWLTASALAKQTPPTCVRLSGPVMVKFLHCVMLVAAPKKPSLSCFCHSETMINRV